jgi:hypothetical protein
VLPQLFPLKLANPVLKGFPYRAWLTFLSFSLVFEAISKHVDRLGIFAIFL